MADEQAPAPTRYAPTTQTEKQLRQSFTYHAPKGDQPARYEAIRAKAKELAELLVTLTPPSREQSLAMTHLEQAVMWANAGIARNE